MSAGKPPENSLSLFSLYVVFIFPLYCEFLQILYSLGARQLMVFGLGPMGCIPLQRVLSTTGACQDRANKLALSFNQGTSKVLDDLSAKLPDANFRFGDAYNVVNDVITNPQKYGTYIYN